MLDQASFLYGGWFVCAIWILVEIVRYIRGSEQTVREQNG